MCFPRRSFPQKEVDEARRLFNEHRFWEVHEVLEGLWKELSGSEKSSWCRGSFSRRQRWCMRRKDEMPVMWPFMLADALKRLDGQPDVYYGWNIAKFRENFAQALAHQKLEIPTV